MTRADLRARLEARGSYSTWVLVASLAGMFATTFPVTILTVSLRVIGAELGASETTMAWVISAPLLLSAISLPLLGKVGDLRGHRRVFLAGSAASALIALATVFAWNAPSLIVFRTLAGMLGAATQPSSMALIWSVFGPLQRSRAMGYWSMTGALAPALGLVVGGPLVDLLGWRVVFALQGTIALAALALAVAVLDETPTRNVRFDVAGSVSLALAMTGFMLALGRLRDVGATSPWVVLSTLAGVVFLIVFVAIERRTAEPLLPLEYFSLRDFSAPILANGFMGAAYMGAFVLAPLIFLETFGSSVTLASLVMLLRTGALTAASLLGGYLAGRVGARPTATAGTVVMTLGLGLIALGADHRSLVWFGAGLVLQGLGNGIAIPPLNAAVASAVPIEDVGIASAANRLISQVGTAFGITILTLAYSSQGGGATVAFAVGGVLSVLAVATALAMEGKSTPTQHSRSSAPTT
jgi:EmrB/QacA subfamily drug resistance transporter